LKKLGKEIITVDLNPISRTSLAASVSITNNITRAVPEMISIAKKLQSLSKVDLEKEKEKLSNKLLLEEGLHFMSSRLSNLGSELLKTME
jgi:4-phosphopantoate--beta-alanine ligase